LDAPKGHDHTAVPGVALDPGSVPATRLNAVLPHLDAPQAFGGIHTALELTRELARHYPSLRLVSQMPLPAPERLPADAASPGVPLEAVSLATGLPLACHAAEVFLCTHWSTVGVWEAYAKAMAGAHLFVPDFYYLIQDFEPDFLPPGEKRDRALATYAHAERCHAVVNSRELARFFQASGYRFAKTHVFLPSLNPELEHYLAARRWTLAKPAPDPLVALVYGRPQSPRNRFEEAVEGLRLFFQAMPEDRRERFTLLSAGQPHPDVEICPGATLKSLGKLPLPLYAALLEKAHVGLSLMASPHPSYPPLEMALFGLKTVTNRHAGKDLARSHPGIVSINAPEPAEVARGLAEACRRVDGEPLPAMAALPASMSPLPWRRNLRGLAIDTIRPPGQNEARLV
jgi:hypothetical protein